MAIYTTEITSDSIASDNPIHQRLLKAYFAAIPYVSGELLEIGCGEGRGVQQLAPLAKNYTAIDKIGKVIAELKSRYPDYRFLQASIPPIRELADGVYDTVVSFQVIEHIKNDRLYLEEIYRLLKKGGRALITTPNIKMSLTRNPWHVREYKATELANLCAKIFPKVEMKGITGNEKVMEYYKMNRESVRRITRWDVLKLQHRLPAGVLKIPYELMNRLNRIKLNNANDSLVATISHEDYLVVDDADNSLDLFAIVEK